MVSSACSEQLAFTEMRDGEFDTNHRRSWNFAVEGENLYLRRI